MSKGFTLVETLVSLSLLLLAVLLSSRVIISALGQSRQATQRFRMVEMLDYYKNYLSSLSLAAPELAEGSHGRNEREFRVNWRVEAAGTFLKRVDLSVAGPQGSLTFVLFRSKFIQEVGK
jgi:prepilin-type N-terminal cleavage/methylation domain-containing protein